MGKVYLYARNTGVAGTALLETTMKNAVHAMRTYRKVHYQLGILNGPSEASVKKCMVNLHHLGKSITLQSLLQQSQKYNMKTIKGLE